MDNECGYCKKEIKHDGNCSGKWDGKPCLLFERDPRGKWIRVDVWYCLKLGSKIPKPGEEIESTILRCNIDKKIKIYAINDAVWNTGKKGLVGIKIGLSVGYWSDEGGVVSEKPKLRLVKS